MTDFEARVAAELAVPSTRRRHPGIRLGSGRAGRPSKLELESFRRFLGMLDLEACEALGYCECGTRLDTHPPLIAAGPLMSDHSRKMEEPSDSNFGWNGAVLKRPKVALARRSRGKRFEFRPSRRQEGESAPLPRPARLG